MAEGARSKIEPRTNGWPLPMRGVWNGINDSEIPANGLFDASNFIVRDGKGRGRPGIAALHAQIFDSRPTGSMVISNTDSSQNILMGTLAKVWTYDFSSWTDQTGTLGGDADNPVRMTTLVFGSPEITNAYICNNKSGFGLKKWKTGQSGLTAVSGSPPTFKDVISVADRIVGLVGAYGVQWGPVLGDTVWNATNKRNLSDTTGETRAIRANGTLGMTIYKSDSIWLGQATGLSGGAAFCFRIIGRFKGPGGPAAVVSVGSTDYYMTQNGRVGRYDGATFTWVADGAWALIKAIIDQSKPGRITGWYVPNDEEIWFTFPRSTPDDSGENLGLLILKLPKTQLGETFFSAWPGVLGKSITTGVDIDRASFKVPIVFTSSSSAEQSYTLDGSDDDGSVISGNFKLPLQAFKGGERGRLLYIEPFVERSSGYSTVTVKALSSFVLDTPGGAESSGQTLDLTDTNKVQEHLGFDVRGRFIGIKIEFTSAATLRYLGTRLSMGDIL